MKKQQNEFKTLQKNFHGGKRKNAGRKKGSKKIKEPYQTTITIEKYQKVYLDVNNINLSEFLRKKLDDLISDSSV